MFDIFVHLWRFNMSWCYCCQNEHHHSMMHGTRLNANVLWKLAHKTWNELYAHGMEHRNANGKSCIYTQTAGFCHNKMFPSWHSLYTAQRSFTQFISTSVDNVVLQTSIQAFYSCKKNSKNRSITLMFTSCCLIK